MNQFTSNAKSKKSDENCETCTDFKDWLNKNQQISKEKGDKKMQEPTVSTTSGYDYNACPLFRDQLGRATWSFLHTMAAHYPKEPNEQEKTSMRQFIDALAHFFPCKECSDDFVNEIKKSPPKVDNRLDLSKWFCDQHNIVNLKLGKEAFDCDKVMQRWKFSESKNPNCK